MRALARHVRGAAMRLLPPPSFSPPMKHHLQRARDPVAGAPAQFARNPGCWGQPVSRVAQLPLKARGTVPDLTVRRFGHQGQTRQLAHQTRASAVCH